MRQGHWASHCPDDYRDRQIWGVLTTEQRVETAAGTKGKRLNCNVDRDSVWTSLRVKTPRGLEHRGGSHFCRAHQVLTDPGESTCRPSSKARNGAILKYTRAPSQKPCPQGKLVIQEPNLLRHSYQSLNELGEGICSTLAGSSLPHGRSGKT